MRTCDIPGCGRKHQRRGLCNAHAQRADRGVPLNDRPINRVRRDGCTVEGCQNDHLANGLCRKHHSSKLYADNREQRAIWLGEGRNRKGQPLVIKFYLAMHIELMEEYGIEPIADMVKPEPRKWTWDQLTELTGVVHEKPTTKADNIRQWRKLQRLLPTPDRVHGTAYGYTNYSCRCRPCTDAQRDAMREWVHRKKVQQ